MTTRLSLAALSITDPGAIEPKPVPGLATYGFRIAEFDTWRPSYGGMQVEVLMADTTERATLYSDPFLAVEIPNPQVLLSMTDAAGVVYGKFEHPIYTNVPYRLLIDQTDNGGIARPPIVTLAGEDASLALVASVRGQYPRTLESIVDQTIFAEMFGAIGGDAGTAVSTATLQAAIGAAAAQGGGYVQLPSGSIEIAPLTLPQGVRLRGHGQSATTLICRDAQVIISLGGDGSGLEALTLDGQILRASSIGVHGHDIAEPWLNDILIKRFDVGLSLQGASGIVWHNPSFSDCRIGAELLGDSDASGDGEGAEIANAVVVGGSVSLCTEAGVLMQFVDRPAREIAIDGFGFVSNVGPALKMVGARGITVRNCYWSGNTAALSITDGNDTAYSATNTTQRVTIVGGQMNGGTVTFDGACQNVMFDNVEFRNVDFVMEVPAVPILLRNCIEDADTTSTGDIKKLARQSTYDTGEWTGITTDATPAVAWQQEMAPGEIGLFNAKVTARARNAVTYGIFWVMAGVARPGGVLNFNLQTGNYTAGNVVTGATSGASARIQAVTQSAGSGNMTLRDITGTFISGELLTDSSTGSARVSGSLSTSNAALDATGSTAIRADTITGTGWDAAFSISGSMMQLMVTGEASVTIDWTVRVDRLVA